MDGPRMCPLCCEANAEPGKDLCTACREKWEHIESLEHPVANEPYCGTCFTTLNASGECPECIGRSIRQGKEAMVSRG